MKATEQYFLLYFPQGLFCFQNGGPGVALDKAPKSCKNLGAFCDVKHDETSSFWLPITEKDLPCPGVSTHGPPF